jgi:hypothetical protein
MQMSFPRFLPQTDRKRFDWFVHELHARRRCRLQHAARENIVFKVLNSVSNVTERMRVIGRLSASMKTVQQQGAVSRVDNRVDAFRKHRGASTEK